MVLWRWNWYVWGGRPRDVLQTNICCLCSYLWSSANFLKVFWTFLNARVMFAISKEDENQDFSTESLKLIRIHFYSFLSVFSNFKIYFRISSLFIFKKNNDNFECFLHTSPMPSMLRWFLYFTTRFKKGSLRLLGRRWQFYFFQY